MSLAVTAGAAGPLFDCRCGDARRSRDGAGADQAGRRRERAAGRRRHRAALGGPLGDADLVKALVAAGANASARTRVRRLYAAAPRRRARRGADRHGARRRRRAGRRQDEHRRDAADVRRRLRRHRVDRDAPRRRRQRQRRGNRSAPDAADFRRRGRPPRRGQAARSRAAPIRITPPGSPIWRRSAGTARTPTAATSRCRAPAAGGRRRS